MDSESINGLNLYCYCINNPILYVDPSGHFILEAIGISAAACYAIIAICAAIAVAGVVYLESETHIISDTVNTVADGIDEALDSVKSAIIAYAISLVIKNEYNSFEKHHIVAKRDPRAWFSKYILYKSGIGIDDPRNLVYVKKGYHRVLHTNLYYGILNISIGVGYLINGSEGVEDVLGIYKSVLGGL